MADFLSIVLALSLGGSLMALLLYGLRLVLGPRLSSTVYYYLWLLVLLRFILPLPGFMPTGAGISGGSSYVIQESTVAPSGDRMRVYREPSLIRGFGGEETLPTPEDSPAENIVPISPDTGTVSEAHRSVEPAAIIMICWLSGTVVFLLRCTISYLRFRRALRRDAATAESWEYELYRSMQPGAIPRLIKSPFISTPMLMGVLSPCLVLPARDYDEETLKNIFLHELKHYSRRDLIYKWFAQLVLAVHWFNPLTYFIRREINCACEISCDEMLISKMDRAQRQSYGETLIALAARRPLPAGIVATSFAMEKRDLKERLGKIMKHRKASIIAALLAVLLLAGCGAATGPVSDIVPTPTAAVDKSEPKADALPANAENLNIYKAENVDQLLEAIGPDRIIHLNTGVYELAEAQGYATSSSDYYYWNPCYDGFELVINGVDNMHIVGIEGTEIVARPRYANVLSFTDCGGIGIESVKLGHSPDEGFCTGGVLYLDSCSDVSINMCSLYGCGTIGIHAVNCKRVYAENSEIYDCSNYGVSAISSQDVRLESCSFHSNRDPIFQSIFRAESCDGFAVVNCEIYDNEAEILLTSAYSQQVSMLGCSVHDNLFMTTLIHAIQYSPTVDMCSFEKADRSVLYGNLPAVDLNGNTLTLDDIMNMKQGEAVYDGPKEAEKIDIDATEAEDGYREVTVKTVDEFLAAIADNTIIKLEGEVFDLSTASDYGAYGGDNYYWMDMYDGPGLVISGVENLSIQAEGDCTIAAIPRYVNVISFVNCKGIGISGITLGHTEEPGSCMGGVLDFQDCWGIDIENCHLFGCGILGITAKNCSVLKVENTEIYDCSQGAIALHNVMDAGFDNMDIHDCYTPEISLNDCMSVTYEGAELANGLYCMENNEAKEFHWPAP